MFAKPKRDAEKTPHGLWRVTVTPPPLSGFEQPHSVLLTQDQYRRYRDWLDHHTLIQDALPDVARADREILMTGIGPEDWDREFSDD